MRIGMGYDVHRLAAGRELVLGGVTVPYHKGLEGHSDADVLVHAICDALLGAAGLGDIGGHFPDSDACFKGIGSLRLLSRVMEKIGKEGFSIGNIDSTLFAQAPKISSFRKEMEKKIAETLEISTTLVNVKATTTEGLGFVGKGEGMAAMSVALLKESGEKR
jgi:2-C-methyl-D-erythritol 2,4-cyclodiphosphate synthase